MPESEGVSPPATSRVGAIDGLRAVSALAVFVFHLTWRSPILHDAIVEWSGHLDTGVEIFFLMSGFLVFGPFAKAVIARRSLPAVGSYYGEALRSGVAGVPRGADDDHRVRPVEHPRREGLAQARLAHLPVLPRSRGQGAGAGVDAGRAADLLRSGSRVRAHHGQGRPAGRRRLDGAHRGGRLHAVVRRPAPRHPPLGPYPAPGPVAPSGWGCCSRRSARRGTPRAASGAPCGGRPPGPAVPLAVAAGAFGLLIWAVPAGLDVGTRGGERAVNELLQGLIAGALCLPVLLAPAEGTWWTRLLSNRALAYFGTISYGFYLWHIPVLAWVRPLDRQPLPARPR